MRLHTTNAALVHQKGHPEHTFVEPICRHKHLRVSVNWCFGINKNTSQHVPTVIVIVTSHFYLGFQFRFQSSRLHSIRSPCVYTNCLAITVQVGIQSFAATGLWTKLVARYERISFWGRDLDASTCQDAQDAGFFQNMRLNLHHQFNCLGKPLIILSKRTHK